MPESQVGAALSLRSRTASHMEAENRSSTDVRCRNASRLSQIASVLGVSIGELFESSRTESPRLNSPIPLLAEPGALRVLKAYARTTSPRVRLCVAKLVESIASRTPGAKATVAMFNTVDRGERRKFPSRG